MEFFPLSVSVVYLLLGWSTLTSASCPPGWIGPNCDISACSFRPCQNNGNCTDIDTCTCPSGWTGVDCTTPICSSPCTVAGWCAAPNACHCIAGWHQGTCGAKVTCATPCSKNAQCVLTDTCACLSGWSGTNCDTPTQWMYPSAGELLSFKLDNGDFSNYDTYIDKTITGNPQSATNALRLTSAVAQVSTIWSKRALTGLPNFNVNLTMSVRNVGNTTEGFSIQLANENSILRPEPGKDLAAPYKQPYSGLYVMFSPLNSKICFSYFDKPNVPAHLCEPGTYQMFYDVPGPYFLRQKWHIGLAFERYEFKSLYICNVSSCRYVFENLKGFNISTLHGSLHLGVGGTASDSYDVLDLLDVHVYKRNLAGGCSVACTFGTCYSNEPNVCSCSPGYTGSACDTPVCKGSCKNGGTCVSPDQCSCTAAWTGSDCSMKLADTFRSAVNYELQGANVLSSLTVSMPSDCALACRTAPSCLSANFDSSSGDCQLLDAKYGQAGTTLVCAENFTHWEVDPATAMVGYFPSISYACDVTLTDRCAKLYERCQVSCSANKWTGSCQSNIYENCTDAYSKGERVSGIYSIKPDSGPAFEVWCELTPDALTKSEPGYVTIFRRKDGSQPDAKFSSATYNSLLSQIGDLDGEFWLGAANVLRLTTAAPRESLLMIWPFERDSGFVYGKWSSFQLGLANTSYTFSSSGYTSPHVGSDLFRLMNGYPLRAKDSDVYGCASAYGPVWTNTPTCVYTNLFGRYLYGYTTAYRSGISFVDFMGYYYSHRAVEWRLKF